MEIFGSMRRAHQAILSEKGHEKTEAKLLESGVLAKESNLYDATNINLLHHVNSALKSALLIHQRQRLCG